MLKIQYFGSEGIASIGVVIMVCAVQKVERVKVSANVQYRGTMEENRKRSKAIANFVRSRDASVRPCCTRQMSSGECEYRNVKGKMSRRKECVIITTK
jgi:hypothetical protein